MLLAASLALALNIDVQPITVDGTLCHPRNLLVKVADDSALPRISATGARVIKYLPEIHWAIIETPAGKLEATRKALQGAAGVEEASLDRCALPAYTPNDPKWGDEWHMPAIKADLAWDTSLGTNAAIVAVIDTGIQVSHPDLTANIWVNSDEIGGNGIDDDGNGYIDDVNGYDFAYNDNNPDDDYGHGTACAGLVAAVGDNGIGVCGVAPRARIMAIKAANSSGYFYDSYTVPAYMYAVANGARVFSMSFYSDRVSAAEEDALNYAAGHNVVPVAAAANDSTVYSYYPGAYEKVVGVATVDSNLNKAGFSDWGSWVDVAAPGVSLTTTAVGSSYTGGFGGTSGACPHVAGLAALLIGAHPGVSANKVKTTIEDTATALDQAPFGEYANYGLVNAQAAMAAITGPAAALKSPRARWISPIGTVAAGKSMVAEAYGRNLAKAQVYVGAYVMNITAMSREFVKFKLPEITGGFDVKVNGSSVASYDPPLANAYVFPLIEGSTKGATSAGGFDDTLNADAKYMKVTRRSDGTILLEATFRNVPKTGKFTLVVRRSYLDSVGTESVQLYNWALASYPYASFDTFSSSGTLPSSTTESHLLINNITPYVDFDKTAYFRIVVNGAASGNELHLDQAYLRPGLHP